jgi:hypothetical protein
MKRRTGRRVLGLVFGFLAVGLTAEGCGSFQTICEEAIDCENGNDADVDACVVTLDAEEERASLYGCTEWYDLYAECREKDSQCQMNRFGLFNNDCDDEARDFSSCMGDNLPPSPF